jgi:hypothetical protein
MLDFAGALEFQLYGPLGEAPSVYLPAPPIDVKLAPQTAASFGAACAIAGVAEASSADVDHASDEDEDDMVAAAASPPPPPPPLLHVNWVCPAGHSCNCTTKPQSVTENSRYSVLLLSASQMLKRTGLSSISDLYWYGKRGSVKKPHNKFFEPNKLGPNTQLKKIDIICAGCSDEGVLVTYCDQHHAKAHRRFRVVLQHK